MITSTARNKDDSAAAADGRNVRAETAKGDSLVGGIETTSHGVDDRLGLLENLLLHEVIELALHDLLKLKLQGLDGAHIGAAVRLLKAVNVQRALVDVSNIIVLKVHDLLSVLDNGRRVRREEEFGGHGHAVVGHESARLRAVQKRLVGGTQKSVGVQEVVLLLLEGNVLGGSLGREGTLLGVLDIDEVDLHALLSLDTDDKGRTLASSDDLMRVVNGLDQQSVGTLELVNDSLGEVGEANIGVLVVQVLGELSNALGVGFGLELEALGAQEGLELLVVGDDTIVDDGELPGRVRSRRRQLMSATWFFLVVTRKHSREKFAVVCAGVQTYLWGWQFRRDGGP